MAMLGIASFICIHTATPYSVGAGGAYSVAGTPFRCRLAALLAARNNQMTSQERAELINKRLLMTETIGVLEDDVQLEVNGERWNLEGHPDPVYGVTGNVEYYRVHCVRAL